MKESKIAKERLPDLIAAVSEDYEVHGPVVQGDAVVFRQVSSAEEMALDRRNSTLPPNELFLPRAEVVYEFDGQGFVDDVFPDEKRVVFGLRPCDCRALTLLDRVFDGEEVQDPFYVARRENTILVALACNQPLSTCFCTAVGGDPFGEEGADVLLGDTGDAFLAKAVTPKGEEFLERYNKFFSAKGGGDWQKQAKAARDAIKTDLKTDGLKPHLDELFENDIWEVMARKCLGCGACSYLCPTCYCFDLTDEKTATGSRKIRKRDCCMFALFTLHASGHNPRAVQAARLRQRIMHKFSYYPERYGVSSCVGCGRCVRSCPANADIRELLGELIAVPAASAEK